MSNEMLGEKSQGIIDELFNGVDDLPINTDPAQAQIPGEGPKSQGPKMQGPKMRQMGQMGRMAMEMMREKEQIQGVDSFSDEDQGINGSMTAKSDGDVAYHPGMTNLRHVALAFLAKQSESITRSRIDEQIELARYFLKQTEPKPIQKAKEPESEG